MKKLKLNGTIKDITGKTLSIVKYQKGIRLTSPFKFCEELYYLAKKYVPENDNDAKLYFDVAELLYKNMMEEENVIEVSDEQYDAINSLANQLGVVPKKRFLEMVEEENKG